jgi:hypothetical protein
MEINELVTALEEQEENMKVFLDCVAIKQKAIIQSDIEALQNSLVREERLLSVIDSGGKKISFAIENLSGENGLNTATNSLTDFINSAKDTPDTNLNMVGHLQSSIKELILKSAFINEQNKILISHSRNFIKETISMLVGLSKGPILDRKV